MNMKNKVSEKFRIKHVNTLVNISQMISWKTRDSYLLKVTNNVTSL